MAERDGWDGLAFTDSQNLGGDSFAALAIAAQCTYQITLATGATNPVTRHPAVIASAIATVHVESGGRAWLGIARGDSAMGISAVNRSRWNSSARLSIRFRRTCAVR